MFYLVRTPEAKEYVPMSYETWQDLKSLEPGKFTLDYEDYIRLIDKPQFDAMGSGPTLKSMLYSVTTKEAKTNTLRSIKSVEQLTDFIDWVPSNIPDLIFNAKPQA